MKTTMKSLLGFVLCVALLSSCQKDKQENLQGSVVFKVQTKNASNLKSTKPTAAAIIISIEKNGGGVVYDKEKLELTYLNGSYLSKGLALPEGNYNLTEFLVTDANNQAIYATPKTGSHLAQLITKPLPLNFNAYSNLESILIPEVVPTDTSTLNDLGYIGFSFDISSINFLITVLSKNEKGTQFYGVDSCDLSVEPLSSYTPIGLPSRQCNFKLAAASIVNSILVKKDTEGYLLTIWKKGYNSWADTLSLSQLESYSNTPFNVILTPISGPSIWLLEAPSTNFPMSVVPYMTVKPGTTLYIDYGRGKSEKIQSNPISMHYAEYSRQRLVQIYGDVDGIKTLSQGGSKWGAMGVMIGEIQNATSLEELCFDYVNLSVDIQDIKSLKKFCMSSTHFPSLTFENMESLEDISIKDSNLDTIDIHTNNNLKKLRIDGTVPVKFGLNPNLKEINVAYYYRKPTSMNLSGLLTALLGSVRSSPREGLFWIATPFQDIPILTSDGMQAGKLLKTEYNWSFSSLSSIWGF